MSVHASLKERAIRLRKQGFSYSQIQARLQVSRSSLSLWLRHVPLSSQAQQILNRHVREHYNLHGQERQERTRLVLEKYLTEARADLGNISVTSALARVLVSLLHYCEGEKTYKGVYFTNSDTDLVSLFLRLFRKAFSLDERKFRVCMHLHSYHNEKKLKEYWSHNTAIPQSQFIKSFRKQEGGKTRKEGYNGCVSIRYHDAAVAKDLLMTARAVFEMMGP